MRAFSINSKLAHVGQNSILSLSATPQSPHASNDLAKLCSAKRREKTEDSFARSSGGPPLVSLSR